VAPPSMHSGETVEWVNDGEPAKVAGEELARAVRKLAVAALLSAHYPGVGSRHEGALVIGGVFARAGWSAQDISHVVRGVARAAGDAEVRDRVTGAGGAPKVKGRGNVVAGLRGLPKVGGDEVADPLTHWFKLHGPADKAVDLEDRVALEFAEKRADDLR